MSLSNIIKSSINNLVGWYDASDASTLILLSPGSNEISQWINKVPNQNNNLSYGFSGFPNIQTADNGMNHINFPSNNGYGTSNDGMNDYDVPIYTIFMTANLAHDLPYIYINNYPISGLFSDPTIGSSNPIVALNGKTLIPNNSNSVIKINNELNNTQNPTTNSEGIEEYYPLNIIQINLNIGESFNKIKFPYGGCGNIGEILFFSNTVSDLDSNNIYLYLKNKWNKPPPPPHTSCLYTMTPMESQCYLKNYPDLKLKGLTTQSQLQDHWSSIGCREQRNNQCPNYQTKSGPYNYIGCYNSNKANEPIIPFPNYKGPVPTIDDCQAIANYNNKLLFGVTKAAENGGIPLCYIGNDLDTAIQYGQNFNRNQCTALGGNSTYQIYERDKPFPKPIIPFNPPELDLPLLTTSNFANSIETFESRKKNKYLILLLLLIFIIWMIYIYKNNIF